MLPVLHPTGIADASGAGMNRAEASFQYTYGLSFPGVVTQSDESGSLDFRTVVSLVANLMTASCDNDSKKVLYDHYHRGVFARPRLDEYLPSEYLRCELVVVFLCSDYANRDWCKLEWNVISQLTQDPVHRHRVMFLWRGERNDNVLDSLGLEWNRDGFLEIDRLEPKIIWDHIYARHKREQQNLVPNKLHLNSNAFLAVSPVAAAIGLPSAELKTSTSTGKRFQRLALIFLSPRYQKVLYEYAEDDRYVLYCCARADASKVYEPFSLGEQCEFIDLANPMRDWAVIAQALATWASESSRSGSIPLVELFLPCELLDVLVKSDFLNVQCHPDSAEEFPDDQYLDPISLASLCPLVVRPLDRYLHHQLRKNIDYLQRKYAALAAGDGRWIHGGDAASTEALIARRDSPEDVAIRMVNDLPQVSDSMAKWLRNMIASMVPVALWWAVPAHDGWETHLQSYKSVCETRLLLEIGPAGEVTMLSSDLDHLALQRKRLHHKPHARSLLLMIDNPDLVPDLLASPIASGSSTPSYSVRSMS